MPYAAGVYTVPPGTTATTLTPIDSSDYNAFVADIAAAQNTARPVVAGGTGLTALGTAGQVLAINAAGTAIEFSSYAPYPTGHLWGLTLSNGTDATNDLNLAIGECRSSDGTTNINIASAMGKRADAVWEVGGTIGTPLGGRFYTSLADGTLHFYVIKNPTTGVCDSGFSDNVSDPTGGANYPAGYTKYRRVFSIPRESAAIVAFTQIGDEITRIGVFTNTGGDPGTTASTITTGVPTGISVVGIYDVVFRNTGTAVTPYGLITSLLETDLAPSVSVNNTGLIYNGAGGQTGVGNRMHIRTNTSGQIRLRLSASDANCSFHIHATGWIDRRGRDA